MAVDLKDPEVKAAIKAAVDTAVEDATGPLAEKNKQLLDELKKARKGQQIDPADYQAVQNELEQAQGKLKETEKALKTAQTESEKIKKAYETESKVAHKLLVDNGLTAALLDAKVKPELMEGAQELLRKSVVLVADGEERIAKIGDKLLKDAVTEWAKSDKGKHYVAAPVNAGGGGNGGGGNGGGAKTMTRTAFEALSPTDKMAFTKEGGQLTAA